MIIYIWDGTAFWLEWDGDMASRGMGASAWRFYMRELALISTLCEQNYTTSYYPAESKCLS